MIGNHGMSFKREQLDGLISESIALILKKTINIIRESQGIFRNMDILIGFMIWD